MKKIQLENKIKDVVTMEEYRLAPDVYKNAAIIDNNYVYPVKTYAAWESNADNRVGYYIGKPFTRVIEPDNEKEKEEYSAKNIIDFDSIKDIKELMETKQRVKEMELSLLSTCSDNIFTPIVSENDTPEMKGLKEAVKSKNIDIEAYADRFGGNSNFSNGRRLFNRDRISSDKLREMLDIFDLKGTLIIEDANEDVANPMNKRIIIELNSGLDAE